MQELEQESRKLYFRKQTTVNLEYNLVTGAITSMGCCGGEGGGCGRRSNRNNASYIDRLEVVDAEMDEEREDLTIDYIEQQPEQEEQHYEVPSMEFLDPERHPER